MKHSILYVMLLSVICLFSCDKEITDYDKEYDAELREGDIMDKKECFEIEYPIGLIFPDKKVVDVKDEEDFYDTIKKWYKANPKTKEKPGLQYPIQVNFKDDISKPINNEKEMESLKEYCEGKTECFALVYPLDYEMPDGVIISGGNEKDVKVAMEAWYKENPSSKEKSSLVYPVDVVLNDGSTITIGTEKEMIELKKKC